MLRNIAKTLLLVYAFAVPWEYSLDLGEPFGNVARIMGLLLVVIAIPEALEEKIPRRIGALQWAVLALYLYFCCTLLWTINSEATFEKIRAYFQTMMIVWIVWELAETHDDLRNLLRAIVAGSWVLAILTVLNFVSPAANAAEQIRFVAEGQDPNDVARFLNICFPLAALLFRMERDNGIGLSKKFRRFFQFVGIGYLPLGLFAVLLTASRGGFAAAILSLIGSLLVLSFGQGKRLLQVALFAPVILVALWFALPAGVLDRLATLPIELTAGDLNERVNIWSSGWQAFHEAPWFGSGAGTFITAAHLAPEDTAHNTALTILVTGGILAFILTALILGLVARSVLRTQGVIRIAIATSLLIWCIASMVGTVEENRMTWLLFALIGFAGRLSTSSEPREGFALNSPLLSPQI